MQTGFTYIAAYPSFAIGIQPLIYGSLVNL